MRIVKSDVEIQRDVLEELKWDTRVEAPEVGVEVDDGVVTLTGAVSSYAKKIAAQNAAHRVVGVLDVVNDLRVHVPLHTQRSDTEIAQAVRQALMWDVFVPEEHIRTTVTDGWVTLEGEVERLTQWEDAENAIRHLEGVRGVNNRLTIHPPEVDAEELRETIEAALERRADREAGRIGITVTGGRVTLTGRVQSWRERKAVVGTVSHAPGVRVVEDQLELGMLG